MLPLSRVPSARKDLRAIRTLKGPPVAVAPAKRLFAVAPESASSTGAGFRLLVKHVAMRVLKLDVFTVRDCVALVGRPSARVCEAFCPGIQFLRPSEARRGELGPIRVDRA